MAGTIWSWEETLAALAVYCRTPFGKLHARNPEIVQIAAAMGRRPAALAMKCCNLASQDPAQRARGVTGLSKTSKLDRQIWSEFESDPESIAFEAETSLAELAGQELRMADSVQWEEISGLDRETMTRVRVNQAFFRTMILAGYRTACAVCSLPVPALLVASHIVPWSIDPSHRMNPRNGICLCSLHDKAFDRGLMGFDDELNVRLSATILAASGSESIRRFFLAFQGQRLNLPDRWRPDPSLLRRHAEMHALGASLRSPGRR